MPPHVERVIPILHAADRFEQLRRGDGQEPVLAHHFEGAARGTRLHALQPFVADTLGAHLAIAREGRLDRPLRFGFEFHLERRHEARGAQHAQAVLGEAGGGIPHGPQDLLLEIREAAERVDQAVGEHVVRDGVDGEIAARQVVLDVVDEVHGVGASAVRVGRLPAQRRHLIGAAVEQHRHRAVLDARRNHAAKEPHDLFRSRAGRDVPVVLLLGRQAAQLRQKLIADRAADGPGAVTRLRQARTQRAHVLGNAGAQALGVAHGRTLRCYEPVGHGPPATCSRGR